MFRVGDIGKQEKKMRAELAQFKRQLQAQRDASAMELQRLQHPSPSLGGSTSHPASALSASTASSNSPSTGYECSCCSGRLVPSSCRTLHPCTLRAVSRLSRGLRNGWTLVMLAPKVSSHEAGADRLLLRCIITLVCCLICSRH